jgi:signal transduction histidine kinase
LRSRLADDAERAGLAYGGGMPAVTRGTSRLDAVVAATRGVSRRDALVAIVVAVVQVGATTAAALHEADPLSRSLDLGAYLLLLLGPVLLLWRNRCPSLVLPAVFAATLLYALLDYPRGPIFIALIVAFVHAILQGKRILAYGLLVVGYLAFTQLESRFTEGGVPKTPILIGVAAWLLVLLVGSELIRMHQAYIWEKRHRRLEVELAEEAESRRRASEERLEIARELHDVMAHSISLINVQAGVALELMDRRPEQARQALTVIKNASKDALLEVQVVLASLRGTPESAEAADACDDENGARPRSPSLSELEEIVTRARLSGVRVQTQVKGAPLPLSAGPDQAGARIVQEALTNVARHAGPTLAQVQVSYCPDAAEVVIVVDNDAPPGREPAVSDGNGTGGQGIPGMRERAEAHGGTLAAGPRPGGFRVEARLPIGNQNARTAT